MYTRSITQDDIAELLRQVTTARARADAEKSTESTIELAKKQAETAEAYLIMGDVNESKSLFAHSLDSLSAANLPAVTADFCKRIGKAFSRAGKNSDAAGYF